MLIPYGVDVPQERWPIANWVLIAATICISGAGILSPEPTRLDQVTGHLSWPYTWMLHRDGFALPQLAGYLFVHAGIIHLLGNMLVLFCFGNAMNAKLGHALYLAAYFVLGALSGLAWLALGHAPYVLGASGAIMGIVGMFLIYFPRNDVHILYFFWFFYVVRAGFFSLSSYWLIALYIAFDLWGLLSAGQGVAYLAHVVGAVAGLLLALMLLVTGVVRSADTEENLLQLLHVRLGGD